jgi:flagellar hook assembly protein FlgD
LYANYPNPFISATNIQYQIPVMCDVLITVYNLSGQKIKTLVDEKQLTGRHVTHWDATDQQGKIISPGVYLLTMKTKDFTKSIILSFIK